MMALFMQMDNKEQLQLITCRPQTFNGNGSLARNTTTKMLICPGWETPCCPGFPTGNASPGQKGCPFVPGLATGTKGAANAHVAGAPFCPGWCYQPGQKVPFFSSFLFLNSFSISIILLHFN
jgi:hypothetical protein